MKKIFMFRAMVDLYDESPCIMPKEIPIYLYANNEEEIEHLCLGFLENEINGVILGFTSNLVEVKELNPNTGEFPIFDISNWLYDTHPDYE